MPSCARRGCSAGACPTLQTALAVWPGQRSLLRAALGQRCERRRGAASDGGGDAQTLAKVSIAEAQRGSNGEWQKRTVKGLLPAACHGGENPCNQCR